MAASPSLRICFNSECPELKSERTRKGWRLRTGDFAQLCDRCGAAFEEGRFCENFHSKASGWRSCESCGKRVHCGCIVSVHAYMLLDAGGVACIACAKKSDTLGTNPSWPPSVSFQSSLPARSKDISLKNLNYLAGPGPVPWHQASTMFNASVNQPDLFKRMLNDVVSSTGLDRNNLSDKLSALSFEKNNIENYPDRFMNGMLNLGSQDIFENGNAGMVNYQRPQKDEAANSHSAILSVSSTEEKNSHMVALGTSIWPGPQLLPVKTYHDNRQNGPESSGGTQMPSGKLRCDARGQSIGFPRYWPRFTDQDLQQASADSNSVITPLFEKMLSASDAGRIGRLVLPKKCAEAYFPPISQPEGLPLQVQDSRGNEWKFQFRFWPNNNSRMYVLEGVTPCIQSMQLQAGDVVTFSRVEPGGKLLMGFRKSSIAPASDQDLDVKCSNGAPTDVVSSFNQESGHFALTSYQMLMPMEMLSLMQGELEDPTSCSKVDKSGYSTKDAIDTKPSISRKRKNSVLGLKNKRLKVDEDLLELKVTWEEAQVLLRPPPNHISSIVVIEGFEFEEYEDAPVMGKPTIFATDNEGNKVQWAQCEECFKWRKLPANAFLPSRWTCFGNSWDPDRSFCLAAQELTAKQLDDLLARRDSDDSKKMKTDDIDSLEGLDTLANLAIFGESEGADDLPSSQITTKHPRHRPGCSCIVCIQPPSKGPKHKATCTCNVCLMVKRRFCTLASRREKKQPQKEQVVSQEKPETLLPDKLDGETISSNNAGSNSPEQNKAISESSDGDPNKIKSSNSPFKGQIDLNIQPEREEELSPHRGRIIDLESSRWSPPFMPISGETSTLASNQSQVRVKEEEMNGSTISIVNSHQDAKNSNIARLASATSRPTVADGSCRERVIDVETLNWDLIDVESYLPRPFKPVLPGSSEISAQASNQRQVRIKEEENDDCSIPIVGSSHRDAEKGHTPRFASTIPESTSAARSHWARSSDEESWNWHPNDAVSFKYRTSIVPFSRFATEISALASNQRQVRIKEQNHDSASPTVVSSHRDGGNGHTARFASTVPESTSAASSHLAGSTDKESWNWHPNDAVGLKYSTSIVPFSGIREIHFPDFPGVNERQVRITEEGNNGSTIAATLSSHQDTENGHMTQFASTVSGSTSAAG